MNYNERSKCVFSGLADLEHLYTFTNFPVFMGCVNQPEETDLKENMSWWISQNTGFIQLKKPLPLDILYPESHGAGEIGILWKNHHKAFSHFLNTVTPSSVFEIGGAHGILEKEYQSFKPIPWVILEPNPSPVNGCKARFIKGFFNDNYTHNEPFDTVVHSHVFEHIYEPDLFMKYLANFMQDGKKLVFSLPNMQVMMERKYTNCINFEHTVLLTEDYIDFLLAKYGFKLLNKEYFMEDHSIFYAVIRDSSVNAINLPIGLYEKNKKLYLDYVEYHESLIYKLNEIIREIESPIYLFGAHVFAQYLIAFGLDTHKIVCILDNDINKQDKRLYGTNLIVKSPSCLRNIEQPFIILKAGVYNKEIKEDIINNINSNAYFLE